MADPITKLEKAFRLDPGFPHFARLADLYLKRGRVEQALALCQKGCASFPDYATGFIVLSKCHEKRGDLKGAHEAMEQALRLDPENPSGHKRLAHLFERLGLTPRVLQSLRQAAALDPFDASLAEQIDRLASQADRAAPTPEEGNEGRPAAPDAPTPEAGNAFEHSPPAAPTSEEGNEGRPAAPDAPAPTPTPETVHAVCIKQEPSASTPEEPADSAAPKTPKAPAPPPKDREDLYGDTNGSELSRLLQAIEEDKATEPTPALSEPLTAADSAPSTPKNNRIATMTLAEIYTTQGLTQKAIETYRELLQQEPTKPIIRSKLASLERGSKAH